MNTETTLSFNIGFQRITKLLAATISLVVLLCIFPEIVFGQYATTNDTLYCVGGTTTYIVDLSSSSDSIWTSPPQARAGDCCGTDNNCVQFALTLAPNATGVNFTIPSGCGAVPSGALFYQVDCGPLTSVGEPICLSGSGPFILTFCKPGNNDNCYSIESIPSPSVGEDVITADGCYDTLLVTGLSPDSVTWNSVFPGANGQYNNLLSDVSLMDFGTSGIPFQGYDTVIVTPGIGAPPMIQYEVCGVASGFCLSETWCDTISVNVFPTLNANITPNAPAICYGGMFETITANPLGGAAPYTYTWSTLVDPTIDGATTQSVDVTVPGEYIVTIGDATDCPYAYDTIYVSEYTNEITVDAGLDITICGSPVPVISLNGSSPITGSAIWLNYSGSFSTSDTDTMALYTPSGAEIAAGYVELHLSSTNNFVCPGDIDTLQIFLTEFTATLSSSVTDISCFGFDDGAIDLSVTGGASPFSYSWSNSDSTEDISSLPVGVYEVIVTDSNGCMDSIQNTLNEPSFLEMTSIISPTFPSGTNISCFGANDGAIEITVAGGTAPYSFSWSTLDGSGLVATAQDQSSLTAGTYDVTVTDMNGCTVSNSITLNQPLVLTESLSAFTYPSGDHISCNGLSDGSIDLTVAGGTVPYSFSWSTLDGSGLVSAAEDQSGLTAGTYDVTVMDMNGCTISNSITLIQPLVLTESLSAFTYPSGDHISCNGLSDGSIDLAVGGGSPGYSFSWSTFDGSGLVSAAQDQSGLTAGTYDVTVTDMNGCTVSNSITLNQPLVLTESLSAFTYPSGDHISCNGLSDGSIDLAVGGGSPGYSFSWSTLDGSGLVVSAQDQSGLTAGTYDITVTDMNGCTVSNSITLNQPLVLTESLSAFTYPSGDHISCNGLSDGSIDLTVAGGTVPYSYSWSTLNGSGLVASAQDQSGLTAGTYDVTVTDMNGCTVSNSITLIQPLELTESLSAFTYPSGDHISCNGLSDGSIDLAVGGGSPGYSFSWSTLDGSGLVSAAQDQSGLTAGTYDVTVTDMNGCTVSNSITLNQPLVLTESLSVFTYPSGDHISCNGLSDGSIDLTVAGGTVPYSFSWSTLDGSGLVSAAQDQSGLTSGTYDVTVTDMNGCTVSSSLTLVEPLSLSSEIIALTDYFGVPVSCAGQLDGEIEVIPNGGSPGYQYSWNTVPVQSGYILSGIGEGTYIATVTDTNGCETSSKIYVLANPIPSPNPSSASEVCPGEIVMFDSNSNPTESCYWQLSNGMALDLCGSTSLYIDEPGCYDATLHLTNQFGCSDSIFLSDYICVLPNPIADFEADTYNPNILESTVQFQNQSLHSIDFEWDFGDGTMSFAENPEHTFSSDQPNEYAVLLYAYNEYGCVDTVRKMVKVWDRLIFYVPNSFTPNGDEHNNVFYPSFGSGYNPEFYSLMIFDRWGEKIFESVDLSLGWDGTYQGRYVSDGTYIWKMVVGKTEDTYEAELKREYTGHVNVIR